MNKVLILALSFFHSFFSFGQEAVTYKVGDYAQGGIVFWVDESGKHGLVCSINDQSSSAQWDNEIDFKDVPNGGAQPPERNTKSVAIADGVYKGAKNTKDIINFIGNNEKPFAALICDELTLKEDTIVYNDWYLPSREELSTLYINRTIVDEVIDVKGGDLLKGKTYWSSTDLDCNKKPYNLYDKVHLAWGHDFKLGSKKYQRPSKKYMPYFVRAIRQF